MARKKTAFAPDSGTQTLTEAAPPDTAVTLPAAEVPPAETNGATNHTEPAPSSNGDRRHPVYKVGPVATDKDNSVEAAVWDRVVQTRDGREFTVYSVTVQASWRDGDGAWKRTNNFRGSQVYALVYCLQRCSDWILAQRDPSANCPF